MKNILVVIFIVTFSSIVIAQNYSLSFNGKNDYVDLDTLAGNGVRTIEMWFKPATQIDNSIMSFIALVARNNGALINNHEFDLSFSPVNGSKGKLRFRLDDSIANTHVVFSDDNFWAANKWYHVAAVVSPTQGMMLFINGVKQVDTDSYNLPTGSINKLTAIGKWGNENKRYFQGNIDDVRFSSNAIYNGSFIPSCPDLLVMPSTIGLWNFNTGSGIIAVDSSVNTLDGQIDGPYWEVSLNCKGNALYFNGVDDYVDLGKLAGNGIRTIEMWFKPEIQIDNSITSFIALVARNNGASINNHEFDLSFSPVNGSKGSLRFRIDDANMNTHVIFSDSNLWSVNKWYHVAAVVSPAQGMMLFIDGIKQSDTDSYSLSTGSINKLTAIGRWGNENKRYFQGNIDDLRFSSVDIYNSNFTPPCPDLSIMTSTVGLWNFNEGVGNIAIDSSVNSYDGLMNGVERIFVQICVDSTSNSFSDKNSNQYNSLQVYPNPSLGVFWFEFDDVKKNNSTLTVYNSMGQLIKSKEITTRFFYINIENEMSGIYYYNIKSNGANYSGKLLKR